MNHCWLLGPNLTEGSVRAKLPVELDLGRQRTLPSTVLTISDRVMALSESALASVGGTLPVAELSPEVAAMSKLLETSSTSMLEQSPLGVALTLSTAGPEPGAGADPLDDDTAKEEMKILIYWWSYFR